MITTLLASVLVSGVLTNQPRQAVDWTLADDAALVIPDNRTGQLDANSRIDVAGHRLRIQMKDRSWANTWIYDTKITNSSAAPGRIVTDALWCKLHVVTANWSGGPANCLEASNGRLYLRTFCGGPDCWSLKLADEQVMGGGVTGTNAARYGWAGPVEADGTIHLGDDQDDAAGGWGCTWTGPLSGPANARISLSRAFCLRLGSPNNSFAGVWNLAGGGDGTHRCRLELLKGARFSGRRLDIDDSDLVLDASTGYSLPKVHAYGGTVTIAGGSPATRIAGLVKEDPGVLTLDTPATVEGTVRIDGGVLRFGARLPRLTRILLGASARIETGGHDLTGIEIVRAGLSKDGSPAPGRATETLARLKAWAASPDFAWAWTEEWVPWGSLTHPNGKFETKLGALTDRSPLVMYYDLSLASGSRADDGHFHRHRRAMRSAIRTHWRAVGGIPVFSWHLDHPCTTSRYSQAWYRYKCKDHTNVVADILTDVQYPCGQHGQYKSNIREPFPSPRAWYLARLRDAADFLNSLTDDEGRRIPVIIRYEHEMDGRWFWWGKGWCTPAQFVAFCHLEADYLRKACGADNLLFAYTPDRTWKELGHAGDGQTNFLSWYPGDAYVDIVGFDDYSIGKGKTDEDAAKKHADTLAKLQAVTAFAEEHGKVAVMSETGCKDARDDFWTRLLSLMTAPGVHCAFANTWGGSWSYPETEAQKADLFRFLASPRVLTAPDAALQQAVEPEWTSVPPLNAR